MKNENCILITGGSGKVGSVLIDRFLKMNWSVITTTRNKKNFNSKTRNQLHVIEIDLMEQDSAEQLKKMLIDKKLFPNVLIHNARNVDFLKISESVKENSQNMENEFSLDVVKPYAITNELTSCKDSRINNVIFITSIYGVVAPTPALYDDFHKSSPIQYGVAKAAQIHLTKELAVRLAPNVRVNCVSFGGIKGRVSEEFEKRYESLNPQNKMLEEENVVDPIVFLVSDGASNMTGHNLIVDGGWTIW